MSHTLQLILLVPAAAVVVGFFHGATDATDTAENLQPRLPEPGYAFEAGDVVVLLGRPEQLAIAEQKLLTPQRSARGTELI
ncbi:MAG TPA: hypothetical protein VEN29_09495 [Casimicrobiaceae bacterium]|nr:hypothetical protein [Casimicrobiaceae bacterium]